MSTRKYCFLLFCNYCIIDRKNATCNRSLFVGEHLELLRCHFEGIFTVFLIAFSSLNLLLHRAHTVYFHILLVVIGLPCKRCIRLNKADRCVKFRHKGKKGRPPRKCPRELVREQALALLNQLVGLPPPGVQYHPQLLPLGHAPLPPGAYSGRLVSDRSSRGASTFGHTPGTPLSTNSGTRPLPFPIEAAVPPPPPQMPPLLTAAGGSTLDRDSSETNTSPATIQPMCTSNESKMSVTSTTTQHSSSHRMAARADRKRNICDFFSTSRPPVNRSAAAPHSGITGSASSCTAPQPQTLPLVNSPASVRVRDSSTASSSDLSRGTVANDGTNFSVPLPSPRKENTTCTSGGKTCNVSKLNKSTSICAFGTSVQHAEAPHVLGSSRESDSANTYGSATSAFTNSVKVPEYIPKAASASSKAVCNGCSPSKPPDGINSAQSVADSSTIASSSGMSMYGPLDVDPAPSAPLNTESSKLPGVAINPSRSSSKILRVLSDQSVSGIPLNPTKKLLNSPQTHSNTHCVGVKPSISASSPLISGMVDALSHSSKSVNSSKALAASEETVNVQKVAQCTNSSSQTRKSCTDASTADSSKRAVCEQQKGTTDQELTHGITKAAPAEKSHRQYSPSHISNRMHSSRPPPHLIIDMRDEDDDEKMGKAPGTATPLSPRQSTSQRLSTAKAPGTATPFSFRHSTPQPSPTHKGPGTSPRESVPQRLPTRTPTVLKMCEALSARPDVDSSGVLAHCGPKNVCKPCREAKLDMLCTDGMLAYYCSRTLSVFRLE